MAPRKATPSDKKPAKKVGEKKAPANKDTPVKKTVPKKSAVGKNADYARFIVSEPIDIPLVHEIAGRYVNEIETRKRFKQQLHKDFTSECGCYVFYIETKDETKPVYVGCTVKQNLGKESITSNKRWKLDKALTKTVGGTLFVVFIAPEESLPDSNKDPTIKAMEKQLIQCAVKVNRRLENKQGVRTRNKNNGPDAKPLPWSIDGVLNSDGASTQVIRNDNRIKLLRTLLGL